MSHSRSSQNTRPDLPTKAGRVPTGEAGGNASPLASPVTYFEIEACDMCHLAFSVEKLTPVVSEGLCCWDCCERLRDTGLEAC